MPVRNRVIFIGESRALLDVLDWAQGIGVVPVDVPEAGVLCAVVDRDVNAAVVTPLEAQVRALGLPCLTPVTAYAFLTSAMSRSGVG
jgi:hypothetical protein